MTYCIASVFLWIFERYEELWRTYIYPKNGYKQLVLNVFTHISHKAHCYHVENWPLPTNRISVGSSGKNEFPICLVSSFVKKKKELLMIFAINFFSVFRIISFSDKLLRKQNWSRNFMTFIITRFCKFDRISQSKIFIRTDWFYKCI